ncbi:chaperone modulatory protein CbpM [Nitrosomonas sp. PY1]|uniref:chaperone modulator CbpM n=1 Tax=Nitrosomonas sp. PY1 TaxID=1803906 RepID=UPI001FC8C110|nr:chaperone modulator CbpM [Nitrosomonas sp. PY1]GKS69194.1 chaperone modulatory protein CbpM [Nitrosomonas sp. PY1]
MSDEIDATLLENAMLDLDRLARCCHVSREWIIEHVQCGVLLNDDYMKADPTTWIFDSRSLIRVKRIIRVERDFECHPELAGLVADLIEEVEVLRTKINITEIGNR